MIKKNKNININKIILRNKLNLFLTKRGKEKTPRTDKKRSYYLDNLLNKRIESQISLEKTKIDYYLDKFNDKKNFYRDYNIFYNFNKHLINQQNINNYITIKNNSLSKNKLFNRTKLNILTKNKSTHNKNIFPIIKTPDKYLTPRPNFTNNFVNTKIYLKSICIKNKNNLTIEQNRNNNKEIIEIKSYKKK